MFYNTTTQLWNQTFDVQVSYDLEDEWDESCPSDRILICDVELIRIGPHPGLPEGQLAYSSAPVWRTSIFPVLDTGAIARLAQDIVFHLARKRWDEVMTV